MSARLNGVRIPRQADVVITDSHPMDQDLRQGVKALANAIRAVKPGGVLITLVRAEEGTGVFGLADRKLPLNRGALQAVAPLLVKLVPKMKLRGMSEDDRFFLYSALQAMMRARLIMYGPSIPAEKQANLPFAAPDGLGAQEFTPPHPCFHESSMRRAAKSDKGKGGRCIRDWRSVHHYGAGYS